MIQDTFNFMMPKVDDWKPTQVSELPSWAGSGRIAIDLETKDPQLKKLGPGVRREGKVIGISFAIDHGPAYYLPIDHPCGNNLPKDKVWRYLQDQAESWKDGDLVGANLQYDLDYLLQNDVKFNPRYFRDVQVAEPLLDELQYEYGLNAIARRYGIELKDEQILKDAANTLRIDPKKELYKLPSKYVASYAIRDATMCLELIKLQEQRIDEENLWNIYNLESKLLPILLKMRRKGVRIDKQQLHKVIDWASQEEELALTKIYEESSIHITHNDINKDSIVHDALKACGIEITVTTKKGNISIAANVLNQIQHPVADQIIRARKFNKLRTTFCTSILEHMVGDRIHTTFNQLRCSKMDGDSIGTVSGRLSSTDPNLQQQPKRDKEIASQWRKIYIPEDGQIWCCNDYSQQEPRWTVHFAEKMNLYKASVVGDRYRNDPTTDNHTMIAQMVAGRDTKYTPTDKERDEGKTIFLGLSYWMGGAKLCRSLQYPTKWIKLKNRRWVEVAGTEGQAIIDKFNKAVPFVRSLAHKAKDRADERGYIITALGRKCRFPLEDDNKNRRDTRKALNRIIQGSSADQIKKAMIDVDEAGYSFSIQVHDELDSSVNSPKEGLAIAEIMREAIPMTVPAKVDTELGPNWGDLINVANY